MAIEVTQQTPRQMNADLTRDAGSIVVGVDGSAVNRSAVDWAAHEAERSGRRLVVVTATGQFSPPVPHFSHGFIDSFDYDKHVTAIVQGVKEELSAKYPWLLVKSTVRTGRATDALLSMTDHADELVVGKRGLGGFTRIVVGSTSIEVAGASRIPVIVVPDVWAPADHRTEPILVGVDPSHDNTAALEFGFNRARELGVQLRALHVWEVHPVLSPSPDDVRRWADDALELVESEVSAYRLAYPGVQVSAEQMNAHRAFGLLEASATAQLLVLGRTSSSGTTGGFPFGSVSRAVLHYSETPVAIVPMHEGDAA